MGYIGVITYLLTFYYIYPTIFTRKDGGFVHGDDLVWTLEKVTEFRGFVDVTPSPFGESISRVTT